MDENDFTNNHYLNEMKSNPHMLKITLKILIQNVNNGENEINFDKSQSTFSRQVSPNFCLKYIYSIF